MKKGIIPFLFLLVPTYQLIVAKSRPKRGMRWRRGVPPQVRDHLLVQKQFVELRKKLGLQTSPDLVRSIRNIGDQKASQTEFNKLRLALNQLLSKELLTDNNINEIEQKIAELKNLNPARWPRATDYEEILNLRR